MMNSGVLSNFGSEALWILTCKRCEEKSETSLEFLTTYVVMVNMKNKHIGEYFLTVSQLYLAEPPVFSTSSFIYRVVSNLKPNANFKRKDRCEGEIQLTPVHGLNWSSSQEMVNLPSSVNDQIWVMVIPSEGKDSEIRSPMRYLHEVWMRMEGDPPLVYRGTLTCWNMSC